MRYLWVMISLLPVYLALTANLEVSNLIVGALLTLFVAVLLPPMQRSINVARLPGALLALLQYIIVLMIELIRSGLQVARIVLSPSLPIRPGIIAIPSGTNSELATALSAHAISVTPGELVVEIDDQGVMYTHCLDASQPEEARLFAQRQRHDLLRRIIQ
ncbi:Na(+)/H(+) antiporter subunit E [Thermoflexales bacterium]|nr:Na(+)/H(+) antiporter subunit E [Thermoflexales bacterium]